MNWDKPMLLPLDPMGSPMHRMTEQIKVVETFQYLGIVLHPKLDNHVKLNINPLIQKLH